MLLNELINRSPIRIFEQSIHGGLKTGEIGVITSPNGVGKTSVLVQLAMDKLLQGKKVIHVSFTQHSQHVPVWYEDIFAEFTNKKNLENAAEIKNDLVKNRVLMNFNQDSVTQDMILKSLRAMIVDGGFKAESIIIDGLDFSRADQSRLENIKKFASELGLSIWYSCSVKDSSNSKENIPAVLNNFINDIDVVITLRPKSDHVELAISKDRDANVSAPTSMKLDTKTLLILES